MADQRPFLVRAQAQIKRFAGLTPATTTVTPAELLEDLRTAHAAVHEDFAAAIGPEARPWQSFYSLTLAENQEYAALPGTYRKFLSLIQWDDARLVRLRQRHSSSGRPDDAGGVVIMPHVRRLRFAPTVQADEVGTWELEFESGPVELHYGAPRAYLTVTGATFTNATKTLTKANAFAAYSYKAGDIIKITAGTGVTPGRYAIASKTDASSIVLASDIGGANPADVGGAVYKADVLMLADPPTEGQLFKSDAYYAGATFYVVSGPGIDQYASCVSFTGTTAQATLEGGQEFMVPPDDTSVYEVRPWVPGGAGQFDEIIAWRAALKYRRIRPDESGTETSATREIAHLRSDALKLISDQNTDRAPRIAGIRNRRTTSIWSR